MSLSIGDLLPSISLMNQHDELINVNELTKKSHVVLFFYPKDNTRGCIKEVCSFRDHFEEFKSIQTKIIGISGDSILSHKDFAKQFNLSFSILSDEGNKVRKKLGVPKNYIFIPGRVTYIIEKGGKIVDIVNTLTNPEVHVQTALNKLK